MKHNYFTISVVCILCAVVFNLNLNAQIHQVPQDFSTIQEAIDAASHGDTVLVDTGTYYENIRFSGKNIMLTSKYLLDGDTSFISRTIIDGSQPTYPDSASVVFFEAGETSDAILQGFTLTGGEGTIIESVGDNPFSFREGGAISIEASSPIIQFNLIKKNYVRNEEGLDRIAGGGAIRCRYCDATIQNNVIMDNEGFHNGGIAIYWSSGTVRNNILYQNVLSKEFGGAALLIENNLGATIIENNTIVGNNSHQSAVAGGIYLLNGDIVAHNNIIWNNTQVSRAEIDGNGTFLMEYNSITKPRGDEGDVDEAPIFTEFFLTLADTAPQVDAGNPADTCNDAADSPALGTTRNDMGAYGGPHAAILPPFQYNDIYVPATINMGGSYPDSTKTKNFRVKNLGTSSVVIDSLVLVDDGLIDIGSIQSVALTPIADTLIQITWMPTQLTDLATEILVYHNNAQVENPLHIAVTGTVNEPPSGLNNTSGTNHNVSVFPNPASNQVSISFTITQAGNYKVILTDALGKQVRLVNKGFYEPGNFTHFLNREALASGMYYLSLFSENAMETKPVLFY